MVKKTGMPFFFHFLGKRMQNFFYTLPGKKNYLCGGRLLFCTRLIACTRFCCIWNLRLLLLTENLFLQGYPMRKMLCITASIVLN